jgi:two-component system response regulator PilR (NtrC family)
MELNIEDAAPADLRTAQDEHLNLSATPVHDAPATKVHASPLPKDLQGHLDSMEREILVRALRQTGFNRTLAANLLGLSLRQIRYRIARLKIEAPFAAGDEADDHA